MIRINVYEKTLPAVPWICSMHINLLKTSPPLAQKGGGISTICLLLFSALFALLFGFFVGQWGALRMAR